MSWAQINAALQHLADQRAYGPLVSEDDVYARTKQALGG